MPKNPGNAGEHDKARQQTSCAACAITPDDVWRFASDHHVPFANNLAEQAVRMPKVKQKISGCFRTKNGADTFCTLRSYLATLHKQGVKLFHALTLTFLGQPPQPRFA